MRNNEVNLENISWMDDLTTSKISKFLQNLKVKPSYFAKNAKKILIDEEYIEIKDNLFKINKCFFCDSESIKEVEFDVSINDLELVNFIYSLNYSKEERDNLLQSIRNLYPLQKTLDLCHFKLCYCDNCKKVLKIMNNLNLISENFNSFSFYQLLIEEGTLDSSEEIKSCPCCGNTSFKYINNYYDEHGATEYDIVCKKCDYKIAHFAYGAYDFI